MRKFEIVDWTGNTGFTVKLDDKEVGHAQGHHLQDLERDDLMYQLFEIDGSDCEDEWLFYKTKNGVLNAIAEQLAASDHDVPYCESCDRPLVTLAEGDLTWCKHCGLVI